MGAKYSDFQSDIIVIIPETHFMAMKSKGVSCLD